MTKRWAWFLLLLTAVFGASAVEVGIISNGLDFVLPSGGVGQGKIFVQNDEGVLLDVEFSIPRQLIPFIHIVPESTSAYSVYAVVPVNLPDQIVDGLVAVQLTAQKSAITTADVRTIEKRIPVRIAVKDSLEKPMPFTLSDAEEPVIPLSFNAIPLVLLAVVIMFVANAMLRRGV